MHRHTKLASLCIDLHGNSLLIAGIHVMLDVVVNHVGYGDYSYFHPFNQPEHFHNCTGKHVLYDHTCSYIGITCESYAHAGVCSLTPRAFV